MGHSSSLAHEQRHYRPCRTVIKLLSRPINVWLGLFSRLAILHSKLPSRLPGPGIALMSRTIWLVVTVSPKTLRLMGPSTRCRMVHDDVAVLVMVAVTVCRMLVTAPAPLVRVPARIPFATN